MNPFDSATASGLLTVGGWIIGAVIIVVGMREQVKHLAKAIEDLKSSVDKLALITTRHEKRLMRLEWHSGLHEPRDEDGV